MNTVVIGGNIVSEKELARYLLECVCPYCSHAGLQEIRGDYFGYIVCLGCKKIIK